MNWLIARLKERSTWLGIFTLAGLCGMKIEPEFREVIINAILAVAAVVAFVFREDVRESDQLDQATPIPPIELVGRSESIQQFNPTSTEAYKAHIISRYARYRDPDDNQLPVARSAEVQSDGKDEAGWNG